MVVFGYFRQRLTSRIAFLLLALLSLCAASRAEDGGEQVTVDRHTLEALVKRVDQLEARVRQLEAEKAGTSAIAATSSAATVQPGLKPGRMAPAAGNSPGQRAERAPAATAIGEPVAQEAESTQPDTATIERLDLSKTLLRIRGFGDVALWLNTHQGDNSKADTSAAGGSPFSAGQLDLFITSDLSDRFRFLSDILFEGGTNQPASDGGKQNTMNVEMDRYLLQFSSNDYFNLSAGRGHAEIGYYSAAYQHSTWLQTTTGRPFLFEFEDRGGILPIHSLGLSATGQIPSGALGLHYVAEAGNGRIPRTSNIPSVAATTFDDEGHVAFNVGAFVRPEAIQGYQAGFSSYHDVVQLAGGDSLHETIFAGHSILIRPKFEWLNEAVLVHQSVKNTSRVFNTPGFYSQGSRQFGAYRPYLRYQYVNVSDANPLFGDVGLKHGPSAGIRYDASESVALKFQYDYTVSNHQDGVHQFTGQVGFTF